MMTRRWLHIFLIAVFALMGGHQLSVAAFGETVVICGGDGVKRTVVFDFETGKPVEETIAIGFCEDCLTPPIGPPPGAPATLTAPAAQQPSVAQQTLTWAGRPSAPTARGPPVQI